MGFLNQLFGGTPKVPSWQNVSLAESQGKSIAANQAALPAAEGLVSNANAFSQAEIKKMLEGAIPGYNTISTNVAKNISDFTSGKIPTDVAGAVQNSAAARALTGGFGGSGLAGNLTARDFGLTSLNLMTQGQSMAESWTSLADRLFAPGTMNVSSMFISPEQMFSADMQNQQNKWNTQWLSNQVAAQPNPVMAGLYNTALTLTSDAASFFGGGGGSGWTIGGGSGKDNPWGGTSIDFSQPDWSNPTGGM